MGLKLSTLSSMFHIIIVANNTFISNHTTHHIWYHLSPLFQAKSDGFMFCKMWPLSAFTAGGVGFDGVCNGNRAKY